MHMSCFLDWLAKYEAVAVWLEGIALVAIFIWDRVDAKSAHDETLEQIALVRQQIAITQKQVEVSQNAERAWLMTELMWQDAKEPHYHLRPDELNELKVYKSEANGTMTHVMVRLHCRNSGRSPAWVTAIAGFAEIVDKPSSVSNHTERQLKVLGWMEPLGPDTSRFKNLTLECEGDLTNKNVMALYVQVWYRDIHGAGRYTSCGYIVWMFANGVMDIRRHDEKPERNEST
jgi:hypothetical protein